MHAAVGAAAAAAVAEAAVWCLPVHSIVSAGREVAVPLSLFLPLFVTAFAVAVALACRYRSSPQVGAFAASAGVIAGLVLGRGSVRHIVFLVFVFLLFGIRSVMLAFRDWSEPIATPFLIGGLALLAEAVIATAGPTIGTGHSSCSCRVLHRIADEPCHLRMVERRRRGAHA